MTVATKISFFSGALEAIKTHLLAGRLRIWARRLGVTRLLQSRQQDAHAVLTAEYEATRPTSTTTVVDGTEVEAVVADAADYCRVHTLKHDKNILGALLSHTTQDSVFWDVGANVGLYSVWLARRVPGLRVVCFEPESRCYERCSRNLALNGIETETCLPLALSDNAGRANLFVNKSPSAGTHSLVAQDDGNETDRTGVEVARGDALIEEGRCPPPGVIKIDVEGYELKVLAGLEKYLNSPELKAVLCEIHFRILQDELGEPEAPKRIRRLLGKAGLTDQRWVDASHLIAARP